jgi:hypothetical protein
MTMDFTKDQNPTSLYEVGIKAGDSLPNYVKEATILQEEDLVSLHACAFADQANRLHPIHTKAATYMSAVYLAGAGKSDSKEFQIVKAAASLFDIEDDIDAALSLLPQAEKSADTHELASEKYALSFNIEEEDTWKAYAINNELDVTKAATDAVRDWNDGHIPTDWFFHAARNIVKRANELNISRNEIPEKVWNFGEDRMVDFDNVDYAIGERNFAGVSDVSEYKQALKQASTGEISVEQAIDTWMGLDAVNNISHKRVTSPHEAFYSGAKIAHLKNMAESNIFISDIMIPATEFDKLASDNYKVVRMAFRKEAADNIINILYEKNAAKTTAKIASLESNQQKQLLNLLLKVA